MSRRVGICPKRHCCNEFRSMCPGDGNGRKLTGHHIQHARRLLHYIHGRCFRFRQAGRQAGRAQSGRYIEQPESHAGLPPPRSACFPPLSPPLDKLVFWNDRRLFWAWQTMRREGEAAAVAVALLTRGYICTLPSQYVSPSKSGILSGSTVRISAAQPGESQPARNERTDDRSIGRAGGRRMFFQLNK